MNPASDKKRSLPFLMGGGLLILLITFVLPMLVILTISFAERGAYGGIKPVEDIWRHLASGAFIQNHLRALDPLYLSIYWRSLWMAGVTTLLCALIGYPLAYFIARTVRGERWKRMLLLLVIIPFWTSFLIRTYAWIFILRSEGLINLTLMHLGIIDQPLELLYNHFSVLVGLVYGELPFMILPLYASLEKLDPTLHEASRDLGAGSASTFWRVTFPVSLPGFAAGIILVFIPSLGQFIVSDLLGGAKTILMGNLIQNQFSVARNPAFGSAIAIQLMAMVFLFIWLQSRFARREAP
jgi:spermidine/putrescine transport system permease protein